MKSLNSFQKIISILLILGLVGVVGCDNPISSDENTENEVVESESATYVDGKDGKGKKIKGQYIVVFNDNVKDAGKSAEQLAKRAGGNIKHIYGSSIKGFAITLPEQASPRALEALQNNPNVDFIEQDSEVFGSESQSSATWGLDRSDQNNLPLDGIYNYSSTGENITVYIADSGINYTHVDFDGRATFGFDTFGEDGNDCYGHGTHVAGTVGGSQWGIAKNVDLVSVRVLDCNNSGTYSGVIAGVDWITANATGVSVVNMSLGGGGSSALDSAVENSIASGITYVVSAGNSNADACNYSPARTPAAITVGATTNNDSRADYSNYGSCIDLFAPGSEITSAYIGSNTATTQMWGTSMAAPHVAGTVALYLQNNPDASPNEVESFIISNATQDIVTQSNSQNNHLLYSVIESGTTSENAAPSADFTFSADYLNVQFTDGSDDSDGSIASWAWDFGDDSNSTSQNPSHSYSAAGTYTVSLTVTDDEGATDTVSKSLTVEEESTSNSAPSADFTFSADYLNVQFTDGSDDSDGSIASWAWDFGDGSNSTSQNPSHSYSSAGTYTVSLTVTDDAGATDTVSKSVTVEEEVTNSVPSADFSFSADYLNVQFADGSSDSDGSISDWSWDLGDGSSSTSQNPSHSYSAAGTYTVSLTVTDDAGATDTVSKSVTVEEEVTNSAPLADFSFSADYLNVQFTDGSSDSDGSIASWAWDFGDGSSSTSQNPSYSYSAAGTYTVSLTVTDDTGATDTVSKSLTVEEQATNTDPVINTFTSNSYKTGPWNRVDVIWSVSDADSDLALVKTELLNGTSVIESLQSSVSGGSASGEHKLKTRKGFDSVRITVTDANGNSVSSTKNISASSGAKGRK